LRARTSQPTAVIAAPSGRIAEARATALSLTRALGSCSATRASMVLSVTRAGRDRRTVDNLHALVVAHEVHLHRHALVAAHCVHLAVRVVRRDRARLGLGAVFGLPGDSSAYRKGRARIWVITTVPEAGVTHAAALDEAPPGPFARGAGAPAPRVSVAVLLKKSVPSRDEPAHSVFVRIQRSLLRVWLVQGAELVVEARHARGRGRPSVRFCM